MIDLQDAVREAFGPASRLSQRLNGFHPRAPQLEMALAIANTMQHGGALVVEAGTGVGKTFSYLVPALLSGESVLLSTATKTLQDQLFGRDLPLLVDVLGLPVKTALLKGRASYLCLHRMGEARQLLSPGDVAGARTLADMEVWSQVTKSGDLAELAGLDERSPLIPAVTSTRDNCLGSQCPQARACHVNLARRAALAADVVVVNHHLFFADLAVRESGVAELLPSVKTVIFDEAHQLNEIGVQFLGQTLSTGQLLDLAHDVLGTGTSLARGLAEWNGSAAALEHAARDLRMLMGKASADPRLRWTGIAPDGVHEADWVEALAQLAAACNALMHTLSTVSELAPEFVRLSERAGRILAKLEAFIAPCNPASVRWLDVGVQLKLVESPLDIAEAVKTKLLKMPDAGADDIATSAADSEISSRAWVFTSATLGDDAKLTWFTEPCGLQSAALLKVDSPFDYARQAAVYVPQNLPKPADPDHSEQVAALVARAAGVIGGRTLVLTTTLRALKTIGDSLRKRFSHSDMPLTILVQGQLPKRELMERFRQPSLGHESGGGGVGSILVASVSFWEGFDVPGDALQLVVIDKLPFPAPNDPLAEARSARLQALGRSPFKDYFLPEAAVALKQGAGRLIRHESDRGILVVCDSRLTVMGYGRRLMRALPPMRRLSSEEDFMAALGALPNLPPRV